MSTIECVKQTLVAITNLTDNKYIIEMAEFCIEHVDGINKERIKELEAANEWISVLDGLPESEQGNKVLGHNGDYIFENEFEDGHWCNIGGETMSHWMPLPDPPEGLL